MNDRLNEVKKVREDTKERIEVENKEESVETKDTMEIQSEEDDKDEMIMMMMMMMMTITTTRKALTMEKN